MESSGFFLQNDNASNGFGWGAHNFYASRLGGTRKGIYVNSASSPPTRHVAASHHPHLEPPHQPWAVAPTNLTNRLEWIHVTTGVWWAPQKIQTSRTERVITSVDAFNDADGGGAPILVNV